MKNFFIAIFILLSSISYAEDAEKILHDIEKHMSTVQSLHADYIQKKNLDMFENPVILTGEIYIDKPDKLVWIVKEPVSYSLLIDKNSIVKKSPNSKKLQRISLESNPILKNAVNQIMMWFNGKYNSYLSKFNLEIDGELIIFFPKKSTQASEVVEKIAIKFSENKKYISSIRIVENGGDSTFIKFKNVSTNIEIDPAVWEQFD